MTSLNFRLHLSESLTSLTLTTAQSSCLLKHLEQILGVGSRLGNVSPGPIEGAERLPDAEPTLVFCLGCAGTTLDLSVCVMMLDSGWPDPGFSLSQSFLLMYKYLYFTSIDLGKLLVHFKLAIIANSLTVQ